MAPKENATFAFIHYQGNRQDLRATELSKSGARAHASRISYLRRKTLPPQFYGLSTASRLANSHGSDVDEDNKRRTGLVPSTGWTRFAPDKRNRRLLPKRWPHSPREILDQHRLDPFDTYPEPEMPQEVISVLDYAFEAIWPGLLPNVQPDGDEIYPSFITNIRKAGMQNPHLFHTQVSGAAGLFLATQPKDSKLGRLIAVKRYFHTSEAARLVNEQLRNQKAPLSESLILAVCNFSVYAGDGLECESQPCHPISPLATAQNLHVLGTLTLIPSHGRALFHMVRKAGGLSSIGLEIRGLSPIVQLIDIIYATRLGSRPEMPYVPTRGPVILENEYTAGEEATQLSMTLGTGFSYFQEVEPALHHALVTACETTLALEHWHCQEKDSVSLLKAIVEFRNAVQHQLCSLLPRDPTSRHDAIYETCRIAALLYADLVLYPLPHGTGVRTRLSLALAALMSGEMISSSWLLEQHADFLRWSAMVGAITAASTGHGSFFVRHLALHGEIATFDEFKRKMLNFLWWDYVMQDPTRQICDEVARLSAANSGCSPQQTR